MNAAVIDRQGFRLNVGIIIVNDQGQLLWARRHGNPNAWQFPQGGINANETLAEAMYRELHEELGLSPEHVEIIAKTKGWLRYRLPKHFRRYDSKPLCIGQKQKWFLLRLSDSEDKITLDHCDKPEFDQWKWVDYWFPLEQVISFKKSVYRKVLKEFSRWVNK